MDRSRIRTAFFFSVLIGALLLTFFLFRPYLATLSIAATMAVLTQPLHRRILRLTPRFPSLAAAITVIVTSVVILVPLAFLGTRIAAQSIDLYTRLTAGQTSFPQTIVNFLQTTVQRYVPGMELDLTRPLQEAVGWLAGGIGSVFTGTVHTVAHLFLGIIAFFYFLKDGGRFLHTAITLSPLLDMQDEQILGRLEKTINSVIRGSLAVAVLQGLSTGIGLAIFGVPNAALWGSIAAICALVPTVGTAIILAPAVLYLFLSGHTAASIGLLAWALTAVGLIDNFLGPFLIGKGIRIHPFFILFAVLGGLGFFGPAGFLLGPLVVSLLVALLDIYQTLIKRSQSA